MLRATDTENMGHLRIRTLGAAICCVLLAAACGSTTPEDTESAAASDALASVEPADNEAAPVGMIQVDVAALGTIDSSPLWIAQSQGFFEEVGVEVRFVPVAEASDVVDALLDGRADAIAISPTQILKLVGSGEPLRVVNYLNATSPESTRHSMTLVTSAEAEIEDGCDLENLQIGVDDIDLLVAHAITEMVTNAECDPATVEFVQASLGTQLDLLEEGSVDAVGVFEPYTARASRREFVEVANLDRELCPGLLRCPVGIIAVQDAWADENPELAEEFNRAINRAMLWMESRQIDYRAELVACCGITADDAAELRVADWVGDVTALEADLTRLMDVLESQGKLPNRPDIADVIG